jgi:hypothetical protein
VDAQDVAVGAVKPGEDDHLVAGLQPVERVEHRGVEGQPRLRRALVRLLGRGRGVGQRRLDGRDGTEHELVVVHATH